MKISDFLICDDIRTEITNKHTLVGVYDENLIRITRKAADIWPITTKLAFFIRILLEQDDSLPDRVAFSCFKDEEKLFSADGKLDNKSVKDISQLNIVIMGNPFNIPSEGELRFKLELFNESNILYDDFIDYKFKVSAHVMDK